MLKGRKTMYELQSPRDTVLETELPKYSATLALVTAVLLALYWVIQAWLAEVERPTPLP